MTPTVTLILLGPAALGLIACVGRPSYGPLRPGPPSTPHPASSGLALETQSSALAYGWGLSI
jgi:hypothetical protein